MKNKAICYTVMALVVLTVFNLGLAILGLTNSAKNQPINTFSQAVMREPTTVALAEARALISDPQKAIAEKILRREIIEDSFLNYIEDEVLAEQLYTYNLLTSQVRPQLEAHTIAALEDCFGMKLQANTYLQLPSEINYIIKYVSLYSMHQNATQLIHNDPELSQMLNMEPAKSNLDWQKFIEKETRIDAVYIHDSTADGYYSLIDQMMPTLVNDTQLILERILAREIIENDLFALISNTTLLEQLKQYNAMTAQGHLFYTHHSLSFIHNYFELSNKTYSQFGTYNYFNRPEQIKLFTPRISKYVMYRYSAPFIYNDWLMSPMLAIDTGKPYQDWPEYIRRATGFDGAGYDELVNNLAVALK